MAKISIPLIGPDRKDSQGKNEKGKPFSEEDLKILFSYPNTPDCKDSLEDTILHWIGQTLVRDGFAKTKAKASIRVEGSDYILDIDGPSEAQNAAYAERIPAILDIGWEAWKGPIQEIKGRNVWGTDKKIYPMWNPNELKVDGQDAWRFFLTLGVGLVSHKTLQFFHYPPRRLLDPLRDSMKDPVTLRCRELLVANGVDSNDTHLYETRINSTPIAAPDDQGTNFTPPANPVWGGLIPVGYFRQFERDMIRTLLKPHGNSGYTIPMTAYGKDPRQRFGGIFLDPDHAMIIEVIVIDGLKLKTPILGSNHPYRFYWEAQADPKYGKGEVGSGKMLPGSMEICTKLQQDDLAVVRWQVKMAEDPTQDPWKVIADAQAYWKDPARKEKVCALVKRHGSLTYKTPKGYDFWFALSYEDALKECGG